MHINFTLDRGYDGLKVFEHCNQIENLSYLIRIRSGLTKEIKALPDKELDLACTVSFRLVNSARILQAIWFQSFRARNCIISAY